MSLTKVIIPCYNEAERLDTDVFIDYVSSVSGVMLVFVDDGSSDATRDILDGMASQRPDQIQVIGLEENSGKAEAVRNGFLRAFESAPDFVAFWDADLATPLTDIVTFRDILVEKPDVVTVFGSRVNLLGRAVQRKLIRHYVGRVFATAAATMLRLPIYDTQCGAKMFRTTDESMRLFDEPFVSRWIFDVEIIARLVRERRVNNDAPARTAIYEHPLMESRDVAGSKIKARDFLVVGMDLMRIYFKYVRPA